MCRGLLQQHNNRGGRLCSKLDDGGGSVGETVRCELCGSRASLYCQADDAFLCRECDKWVHQANFLALRHIRCFLCNTCQNRTQRYLIRASREVLLPAIVTSRESRRCNSDAQSNTPTSPKTPFQFL